MTIESFSSNLQKIVDSFYHTELIQDAHIQTSFTGDKKAEFLLQVLSLASQTALKFEDLELSWYAAKAQNKIQLAEALKSLIQSESILEGVLTNAQINRSNAYVGFLNVVGNATESAAISSHAEGCLESINAINVAKIDGYGNLIKEIREDIAKQLKA
ncbi:hypothetical protein LS70_003920 [Helicobacter sp. MIT 11-5569]|uniref:hypothetical protein n=1 Tax=Helicobacter sp. MIT 11-5569 TaxID=1548151 RepID=UPI00069011C3|nr:hypothetical protein [Helicobacter sp. MIT 11-5569]TLD83964.1 hypothetical protein LS70_003920 [Helicobacter sp. MIT 11-5569]